MVPIPSNQRDGDSRDGGVAHDVGRGPALQTEGGSEPDLVNYFPPSRPKFRTFGSYASASRAMEDEIAILEDVDIDIVIPSKLSALDFPKAEDGQEEDVAKVIRKSFSKLGVERHHQPDPMAVLAEGALSLHLSWQAQVEAAVEQQGDEFWQRVSEWAVVAARHRRAYVPHMPRPLSLTSPVCVGLP